MNPRSTVLIVAYGVDHLDLGWVPDEAPIVIVHNDHALADEACIHPRITHLRPGRNLGFGSGMNLALKTVVTDRVIFCNPDTELTVEHFEALDDGDDSSIVTVPLVESDGTPNAVVSPYWSVPAFLLTVFRLGRFAPRGGRLRATALRVLGRYGAGHLASLEQDAGEWPLMERWATGALFSAPTDALRSVGGFEEDYFLYYEDADLQQRLAREFPEMRVRLEPVVPGRHLVGGCAKTPADQVNVAVHRRESARLYASRQRGICWRMAGALIGARS
ncbi:MAG: hypothetical protein GWP47_08270 [Actinobacteria bacterium]|jgi:hypothetical protein|nr:hypothetical protein [Actinomycetota bacterium]NCG37879.1 hypothetical protein [Actinomycetota bacterium]